MKINPVNRTKNGNRFCGPSAISAITGCTTDEASRCIRAVNGKRKVTGTGSGDMRVALSRYFNLATTLHASWPRGKGPTLARWLSDSVEQRTAGRVFLLIAGWHWQVISGRRYVCGITQEIVSVRDERVKRRARVSAVYEVTRGSHSAQLPIPAGPRAPQGVNAARTKARRLATKWGIEIERLGSEGDWTYMVYPPSDLYRDEEDDPHYGDHHCGSDWSEVLAMVEEYANDAKMLGLKQAA